MITILLLIAWFISIVFICRFFHVSCKPYDNPVDLYLELQRKQEEEEEEEEDYLDWEVEQCYRCGAENVLSPDAVSWEHDERFVHEWEDAIFCESCFYDKGKNGQPYLSDLDDMRENPYSYLPHGY